MNVHLLIAPNALKGCCSAPEAAAAMQRGAQRARRDIATRLVPLADGGDGMLEVLERLLEKNRAQQHLEVRVQGPDRRPVRAPLLWLPEERTAIIEMARASGLSLLSPEQRDPFRTTSLGTGECLQFALELGAGEVLIGVGGSATHDGGIGLASALGYRFLDRQGQAVEPTGGKLLSITRIDATRADPRLRRAKITVIRDVDNPLCGPAGAAAVYAPQKGARPDQIGVLDRGLAHLAELFRRDLGIDVMELPGAGAAGGAAAGLVACCGARLEPGADYLLELTGIERHLGWADLVLTAEGRLDRQSLYGKAPGALAARAAARGIPCIAIAGQIPSHPPSEREALNRHGMTAVFSLCPGPVSLRQACRQSADWLAATTEQILRLTLMAQRHGGE